MSFCRVNSNFSRVIRLPVYTIRQLRQLRSNGNTRPCVQQIPTDTDFFGINDITNKDVAGTNTLLSMEIERLNKIYKPLLEKRTINGDIEKEQPTSFGFVRRDSDNVPKEHGQFEEESIRRPHDPATLKKTFCSGQNSVSQNLLVQTLEQTYGQVNKISLVSPLKEFESIIGSLTTSVSNSNVTSHHAKPRELLKFSFKFSKIPDTQTIGEVLSEQKNIAKFQSGTIEDVDELLADIEARNDENVEEITFDINKDRQEHRRLEKEQGQHDEEPFDIDQEKIKFKFDKKLEDSVSVPPATTVMNSLHYLKTIRSDVTKAVTKEIKSKVQSTNLYSAKVKLDSKGYIDFSSQVPDYSKHTKSEILNFLKSNIIYHNHDIVAINKPYGISCHGGNDSAQNDHSNLSCYLNDIAKSLRVTNLHLAHRIDQSTTGLLILATSREKANFLNKLFASGDVRKLYWCITKDVPDPPEGIIDIPIEEYKTDGKSRQGLRPQLIEELRNLTKRKDNSRRAITEYKVLSEYGSASLVEVCPKTGIKHQIRCHLGFGLRTPILGDHKYSHITKLLPQKLPSDLLLRMNVRQAKARTIPMHLHAKSIVLPRAKPNGEDIYLEAPMHRFFARNLRALKLLNKDIVIDCV